METRDRPSSLAPRLENLAAITAEDVLLAYLATSKGKFSQLAKVYGALSVYLDASSASGAMQALVEGGFVATPSSTRCALTGAGRDEAIRRFGNAPARGWAFLAGVALPALALGLDPDSAQTAEYVAHKENLESLTLGRVYGFAAAGAMPDRVRARSLLLRVVLAARFPECAASLEGAQPDGYRPDPLAKALILGLAGMKEGGLREAESILVLQALGAPTGESVELADAIVRAALSRSGRDFHRTRTPLSAFADAVRRVARSMETLPFSGRVAIAEVYDAGLAQGFAFGSLEEFKARVAEACRAGLIDLERHDIAGALDPALRDRSRTPLGRDERHFIVNEFV